jgi:hypothetical protein
MCIFRNVQHCTVVESSIGILLQAELVNEVWANDDRNPGKQGV